MKADFKFSHQIRVRFAEVDMSGVVFNGNYLTYYDLAWTEYFRSLGLTYDLLTQRGVEVVMARTTLEFKSPVRFDEVIDIYARVSRVGDTSITFEFEVYSDGNDLPAASASALYVFVDATTFLPVRIEEDVRARIGALEERRY